MVIVAFDLPGSVNGWAAIDDRVMGGVSHSRMRYDPAGFAVFEGTLSLDQGGGFASVRHGALAWGTAQTAWYRIQVMGDGKRYKVNLRTDESFDGVNYQATVHPPAGTWTTLDIPVSAFVATRRGRTVSAPPLLPQQVTQVGLMIADRQSGAFRLCIKSLSCMESDRS